MTGEGGETALVFRSGDAELPGVLHQGAASARRGVLIVVGGPQYRVGSHRQFVLLARALAARGIPAMRFDYCGMGDAGGDFLGFEHVDGDIRAAIDTFFEQHPSLEEVVLWGLCDAASASLFYAPGDTRVTGLVLLNPWVRTDQGEARAYLTHYYRGRLHSADAWKRVARGEVSPFAVMRSVAGLARRTLGRGDGARGSEDLPARMLRGLRAFRGRVLLVLSGNDLIAAEFLNVVRDSDPWRAALAGDQVTRVDLEQANHTFATRADRDAVASATLNWLRQWPVAGERA